MKNVRNKIKKLKKNDLIEILWEDHFVESGWAVPEYINEQPLMKCSTVGYFIGANDKSLKTGTSIDDNGKYNSVSHTIISAIVDIKIQRHE